MRQLWLVTLTYVIGSIAASLIFPRVEHAYLHLSISGVSVASAQAFLGAVSSGMMALTGIVFSFAFVVLQFSGVAYSPRLLSWVGRDPLLFNALGVFIATFVYALAELMWIGRGGDTYVPMLSTYLVFGFLVASMISLALLVQRIGQLQVGRVLRLVATQARAVIARMPSGTAGPEAGRNGAAHAAALENIPYVALAYSGEPRAVNAVDIGLLARKARPANASIVLACAVGDMLPYGAALCRIYGDAAAAITEADIVSALELGEERSPAFDAKYAIRILVDIAIRALSPAINDPTTAVQSIDQIEDLLARLATRDLGAGNSVVDDGILRVLVPSPTWEDYLELGFDEIRLAGLGSLQVVRRLHAALDSLERNLAAGAELPAVRHYRLHLDAELRASNFDEIDCASAACSDRQGIGLSR